MTAGAVGVALLWAASGCGDEPSSGGLVDPSTSAGAAQQVSPSHDLGMHQPYASLGMNTGEREPAGRPVRIGCATCHTEVVEPNEDNAHRSRLERFHRGVQLDHGEHSSCTVCHHPPSYASLRLANGKVVTYGNAVELCGQCHSAQWRDYRNGAHGGMTGYWDEQRGPRSRNHCLDCHNPHAPAATRMQPAPRARVRFQRPPGEAHE